jgi:hypothetical protein
MHCNKVQPKQTYAFLPRYQIYLELAVKVSPNFVIYLSDRRYYIICLTLNVNIVYYPFIRYITWFTNLSFDSYLCNADFISFCELLYHDKAWDSCIAFSNATREWTTLIILYQYQFFKINYIQVTLLIYRHDAKQKSWNRHYLKHITIQHFRSVSLIKVF